jgi:hypothetical protein
VTVASSQDLGGGRHAAKHLEQIAELLRRIPGASVEVAGETLTLRQRGSPESTTIGMLQPTSKTLIYKWYGHRLPEHQVLALMQILPRRLRSVDELRVAILEALNGFHNDRIDRRLPSYTKRKLHGQSIANTTRKLIALVKDRKTLSLISMRDEPQWDYATEELPADLGKLVEMVERALLVPKQFYRDRAAMTNLLRRLVAIYKWASGKPAKLPYYDRKSGEVLSQQDCPLLDFIQIAGADAFSVEPMKPDAIRSRLRDQVFTSTGEQKKKNTRSRPVRSARVTTISDATTRKHVVASDHEAAEAKNRPGRAVARRNRSNDRGGRRTGP